LFSKEQCKYAHGVDDLQYSPSIPIQKKRERQESLQLEISYTGLYQYQQYLFDNGKITKENFYPLEVLNTDKLKRHAITVPFHIEEGMKFKAFLEKYYAPKPLTEEFIQEEFVRIGINYTILCEKKPKKPTSTLQERKEKIEIYLKTVPIQKNFICHFWHRGMCLFSKAECKFAHGIDDLL